MISTEIATCMKCNELTIVVDGDYRYPIKHLMKRHKTDATPSQVWMWYHYIKGITYEWIMNAESVEKSSTWKPIITDILISVMVKEHGLRLNEYLFRIKRWRYKKKT